jgi:hypothetical protein
MQSSGASQTSPVSPDAGAHTCTPPASTHANLSGHGVASEQRLVHQLVAPRVAQNVPPAQSSLFTQDSPIPPSVPRTQLPPRQWKAPGHGVSPSHARVQ